MEQMVLVGQSVLLNATVFVVVVLLAQPTIMLPTCSASRALLNARLARVQMARVVKFVISRLTGSVALVWAAHITLVVFLNVSPVL
jgi:hypothetical protein